MTLRNHPEPEARGGSWEEPPMPEARAGGQEEQPEEWWLHRHRRALEELSHVEGQERRLRRYPSSKVRSNGCALLERP